MRLTIKSKLVLTIAVVISITITVGLIGMYYLIDNKEEEFIKEDVNIIAIREDVETLISNLIDNALKYSLGERINIRLTSNGLFTIENSCEEIKYEIKDKLLEAFVKGNTQRNINSSGLGLYICKKISENNGFNISYEIDKNKIGFKVEFNIT